MIRAKYLIKAITSVNPLETRPYLFFNDVLTYCRGRQTKRELRRRKPYNFVTYF